MNDQVHEELLNLEKDWTQAILENDAKAIGRFMTDDWVIIGPGGEVIEKARFLRAIEVGDLIHEVMESDDWRVRVYEDALVATARTSSGGKYKGKAFTARERSTSVYVKRDGRWQCVLTQVTAIATK